MTGRRIAILHDSPHFGGHELAFLNWLPALTDSPEIAGLDVWAPETNQAFHEALRAAAHPKITIFASPYVKARAEPFRAPLRRNYGQAVAAFVAARASQTVLLLQGRIENLATPMLWLPRDLDLVSYLPMAHSGPEMGRPAFPAALADQVKRAFYGRPQRIIVPSRAVAGQARRAGAHGAIHVVENVPSPAKGPDRVHARERLGIAPEAPVALFMGRFDTHQKGLDRLLRDLKASAPRLSAWRFLFVGQGDGAEALNHRLKTLGVRADVISWTDQPATYLSACDVLLLPSRFEGVPLVMLEALQHATPILASDIDVYREYLPPYALRDFSHPVDLAAALQAIVASPAVEAYRIHAAAVSARLNIVESRSRFLQAVLGHGSSSQPDSGDGRPCAPSF